MTRKSRLRRQPRRHRLRKRRPRPPRRQRLPRVCLTETGRERRCSRDPGLAVCLEGGRLLQAVRVIAKEALDGRERQSKQRKGLPIMRGGGRTRLPSTRLSSAKLRKTNKFLLISYQKNEIRTASVCVAAIQTQRESVCRESVENGDQLKLGRKSVANVRPSFCC